MDDMVLQAGGANIWGWGGPGANIQVTMDGKSLAVGTVDHQGRWLVNLHLETGGPYNLTVHHRWLSLPKKVELRVLAGEVWLCLGSDNMALPMAGLQDAHLQINQSIQFDQVRFAEVGRGWAEEPQMELMEGLSIPWTAPTLATLPSFSSTCWLLARELHKAKGGPVGVMGVYVNNTDLWPWTPIETLATCRPGGKPRERGNWNAMLYPLLNTSATGGIFYEGQVDVEEGGSLEHHSCMLNGTLATWMKVQNLTKLGLVGLGNDQGQGKSSWPHLRYIQQNLTRSLAHTVLVPSHDLADPGHRISRHKLDLATRILNMTHNKVDTPMAPTITKACFVYIYINLEMSEAVEETEGYPDHGFSACCSTSRSSNTSCIETGPNGSLGLLTSTNTSYLFEQECKDGKGLVTEIYYGWTGGYPYMKSPLYGVTSKLPAASTMVPVIVDHHDPACVHYHHKH